VSPLPISYEVDKRRKLVITTARGPFCADDIRQVRAQLLLDPEFDMSFSELADLTDVTPADITGDQVRLLARSGPFSQESNRPFIARREMIYGLARMFEVHCNFRGDERIGVFRERHEALAWLRCKNEKRKERSNAIDPAK
jgi:hypothetical protein